ncbi:hypothetical protein [Cytobacillus sp. NCCP-133]|uniref:hypothetical protein n=1 Tax=Cytobacillus sp. NCCP-133 TaxID=766848 RepID=UPI0022318382|nr:hypothetical protein [Cytobacillus sp. NCCP-133]GLB58675.1 hypothetical protein NCCP133_08080 [Cytobacillus sp. NCCP-133]
MIANKAAIPLRLALEEIQEKIKSILEQETLPEGYLQDVETVIRGDRARPKPATPVIWLFTNSVSPEGKTLGLTQDNGFSITLSVVYKNDDPSKGFSMASDIALRAREVILRDRKLGLDYVSDIKDINTTLSNPAMANGNLYNAEWMFSVKFTSKN